MFAIAPKRLFWWPVTVRIPSPDKPGTIEAHGFEAQFEAIPLARAHALDEARATLPEAERVARAFDFLSEIVRGWRDVIDADGESVPFGREAFEAQCQFAWFRDGILAAYAEAMSGQEARLGN